MRINVYSQELTNEINTVEKVANTGLIYSAVQLMLHSSPMLHHPPLKTPAGREVYRLKSTSDRSMNEVERAAWTTRAVNYCELITGVEARTLIDEVRARGGGEPELRDAA